MERNARISRTRQDFEHRHPVRDFEQEAADLIERPKMGFEVPMGIWLRGPLRDWAEHLLASHRVRDSGLLDAGLMRQTW